MMSKILKKGDVSEDVMVIADCLYNQGFYSNADYPTKFDTQIEDAVIYFQQTHLGRDGKPLKVDGIVGPLTLWALKHPSGKAQKSNLNPLIPRGIEGARKTLLTVAIEEHVKGVRERPNGSNRGKEVDKYLPTWWMNTYASHDNGPPWCCYFVSWVHKQALGTYPTGRVEGSCSRMAKKAKELSNTWYDSDVVDGNIDVPCIPIIRPGDIFVILHPKKPGKPQTGHTGYVLRVNKNQTRINTIEGNCGNRVKCGVRDVKDITGFINPFPINVDSHITSSNNPIEFVRALVRTKPVAGNTTR